MAICLSQQQDGTFTASSSAVTECNAYVMLDSNDYQLMLQTYEITPTEIAEAFTWGFGTYVFFWFMGYCIKNARQVIRAM